MFSAMNKGSGLILPIFMSRQQLTNSSKPFLYGGGRRDSEYPSDQDYEDFNECGTGLQ